MNERTGKYCPSCGALPCDWTDPPVAKPCTCHPDERPAACQHRYALTACLAAMTNKDGISVEGHAAFLTEWANDIDRNAGGHSVDAARLRSIAACLKAQERAYLALSEREAAKDAEIARLRGALTELVGEELGGDRNPNNAQRETDFYRPVISWAARYRARAALTKGQVDAG